MPTSQTQCDHTDTQRTGVNSQIDLRQSYAGYCHSSDTKQLHHRCWRSLILIRPSSSHTGRYPTCRFSLSCLNDLLPVNYTSIWLLSSYVRSCSLHIELIIPRRLLFSRCLATFCERSIVGISLYWQNWTCQQPYDFTSASKHILRPTRFYSPLVLVLSLWSHKIHPLWLYLFYLWSCVVRRPSGFGSWTDPLSSLYR